MTPPNFEAWNRIKEMFNEHPRAVNETYFQHMKDASRQGFKAITAGLALQWHAVFPNTLQCTGSRMIREINEHFTRKGTSLSNPEKYTGTSLSPEQQSRSNPKSLSSEQQSRSNPESMSSEQPCTGKSDCGSCHKSD